MGLLRLILAISVVIGHSSPIFGISLVGGQAAVQAFYIISGFYMALILKEKYIGNNNSYKLFISNRLLRLFPVYWVIIILIIIVALISFYFTNGSEMIGMNAYLNNFKDLNFFSFISLVFVNVFMIFQDVIMFMGIDLSNSQFFFTANYKDTSPYLYEFLLVPQAWTIGLEIMFYLIAPFLMRLKIIYILILAIASLAIRLILINYGFDHDPWTYRFFPSELIFFLAGIISYEVYKKMPSISKKNGWFIFLSIIFITFVYSFIDIPGKKYIYLFIFFLSLPFIFSLTKYWKNDRAIGELSYPVYISHYFILNIMLFFDIQTNTGLILVILTLILSYLLNRFVSEKIEIYRQSRLNFN